MAKFLLVIFTVLTLLGLSSQDVDAAGQTEAVGQYSIKELKSVSLRCAKRDIRAIRFEPESGSSCSQKQRVSSVAIIYAGGFRQMYEYPSLSGGYGVPMGQQTLNVMPGTRCLEGVSIQATDGNCGSPVRVSFVY